MTRKMSWVFVLLCSVGCVAVLASSDSESEECGLPCYRPPEGPPFRQRAETLKRAIEMRDTEQLLRLIGEGADVNGSRGGITPLMHAAYFGDAQAITQLLKHGADIERQDGQGVTALVAAALGEVAFVHSERPDLLAQLLKAGASVPGKQQLQLLYQASKQEGTVFFVSEDPGGGLPESPAGNGISIAFGSVPHDRAKLDRALALIEQRAGTGLQRPVHEVQQWPCSIL